MKTERDRMLAMGEKLRERIARQDEASEVATESMQRSRAGLSVPSNPIVSLILLGLTGVGKTELCKELSDFFLIQKTCQCMLM